MNFNSAVHCTKVLHDLGTEKKRIGMCFFRDFDIKNTILTVYRHQLS